MLPLSLSGTALLNISLIISANFFTLSFLLTFNKSDVSLLVPAAFSAFMRFSAITTTFTETFSQGPSSFSTFNSIHFLHSATFLCTALHFHLIFQTHFYISFFNTNAWHSSNILMLFFLFCLSLSNKHLNASDLFRSS